MGRLHQAVFNGELNLVESLLKQGANIQEGNRMNDTPLHLAALQNHVPILKLLIEKGANKNAKNNNGETPLHRAASKENTAAVIELVNAGADLFVKNKRGNPCLHLAADEGHLDIFEDLLAQRNQKGSESDFYKDLSEAVTSSTNDNNETTLHRAAFKGQEKVVTTLLEFGSYVNAKNKWGNTPLHLAAANGRVKVVEVLLKSQNCSSEILNVTNNILQTPLHRAAFARHLEIVKLLLKAGANVDSRKNDGYTPLHLATIQGQGHLPIMKELLDAGANMYNLNKSGNTGAHHAAFNGSHEIVILFLEKNFDVNHKNSKGNTLLHLAAREGYIEVVRLLLEYGAKIIVHNQANTTPLTLAARLGHTDVVQELMAHLDKDGIDMTKLEEGQSILHAGAIGNRLRTIQAVVTKISDDGWLQRKWNGYTAEEYANIAGNVHVAWWLRKQHKTTSLSENCLKRQWQSCKDRYESSGSDIMKRAKLESKEQTEWLLKAIVDGEIEMHYMDEDGDTILHAAQASNNILTVKKLTETGALPIARNHRGQTPVNTTPLPLDKRIASYLYTVLLNIISRSVSLDVPGDRQKEHNAAESSESVNLDANNGREVKNSSNKVSGNDDGTIDEERMISNVDIDVQKKKLRVLQIVSKILALGIPLDPPGSCDRHFLPLAITTNNKTLLPILLAAGVPLTKTNSGLGIIQLAWRTPDLTIWVGMVITRAVEHTLRAEKDKMEGKRSDPAISVLCDCIGELITDLNGENPSEAVFKKPKTAKLTELLKRACEQGATMTAWYIWNAGGNHYKWPMKFTPLEAAVANKMYYTAERLVLDMGVNPFIKDLDGIAPIEKYPNDRQLLEMMFGQDYRRLDTTMEKAKDKCDKTEFQQIIILLMVLYLQYISKAAMQQWRSYFSLIMRGYSQMETGTDNWMCTLMEFLETTGVNGTKFVPNELKVSEEIKKVHLDIGLQESEEKEYCLDNTTDHFYDLFYMLQSNFNIQITEHTEETNYNVLLERALRISCEQHLPLLLHLLISVAKQDVNTTVNEACQTRPLHHAARYGNISAIVYLLNNGASLTFKDRGGILPIHYAFMYGHGKAGKYIIQYMKKGEKNPNSDANAKDASHYRYMKKGEKNPISDGSAKDTSLDQSLLPRDYMQKLCTAHNGTDCKDDGKRDIEKSAKSFQKAHQLYLQNYNLNSNMNGKSRYVHVRTHEQLLEDSIGEQKNKWEEKGIRKYVEETVVDYEDEEALVVRNAVNNFLLSLKNQIASVNSIYEGDLEYVGSSVDNVRLYCPDEYDCNLLLKNVSAHPNGGLKCELLEYEKTQAQRIGHKQYLKVQPIKKELEDLFTGSNFQDKFYNMAKESLNKMNLHDHQLKLLLPGIKRTQVGVALNLLWLGDKYPVLFVDIDLVPTVRAPWPSNLFKPSCIPKDDLKEVFVNSVGEEEWRFSFGFAETRVMKDLSKDQRVVFLACKTLLSAFKTENWVPWNIKCKFLYWDSQMFSLSSKGGFALKNSFLRELEDVKDAQEWASQNLFKRMCSVFERMCEIDNKANKTVTAKAIRAYFGGDAEKASVYLIAPEIRSYLKSLENSIIDKS